MRALSRILTAIVLGTLLSRCSAARQEAVSEPPQSLSDSAEATPSSPPHHQTDSESPAIVVYQYPDYPSLERGSEFPGGLVAAMWRDGRLIRATSANRVGESYIEGVITPPQRDELFRFLTDSIEHAPKVDGIPLHFATQSITFRSENRTSKWIRILPDKESVWSQVESRLMSLPLQDSHVVDSKVAESLR